MVRISSSATEAKAIALALPGETIPVTCHQDNTAAIQVIKSGYSARLRHLGKTHQINIQGLYDAFLESDLILQHCPTEQQAADISTKALDASKWAAALSMVGVFDPAKD